MLVDTGFLVEFLFQSPLLLMIILPHLLLVSMALEKQWEVIL